MNVSAYQHYISIRFSLEIECKRLRPNDFRLDNQLKLTLYSEDPEICTGCVGLGVIL